MRIGAGQRPEDYIDLLYADDVITPIAGERRGRRCDLSCRNAERMERTMDRLDLKLSRAKTRNILMPPLPPQVGIFRRSPAPSWPSTRRQFRQQYRQQARMGTARMEFDPYEEMGEGQGQEAAPYLGGEGAGHHAGSVHDNGCALHDPWSLVSLKSGPPARASRSGREAETGVLKITRDAIITGSIRFGVTFAGLPYAAESVFPEKGTCVKSATARRISGLESLGFFSGRAPQQKSLHPSLFMADAVPRAGGSLARASILRVPTDFSRAPAPVFPGASSFGVRRFSIFAKCTKSKDRRMFGEGAHSPSCQ